MLTGAITQIRADDIAATKTADGVAALQGKIPGLLITQNSGKPGAFASDINLRGFGTPMVVVDGVVRSTTRTRKSTSWNQDPNALESYTDLSVLQELNPEDIESISDKRFIFPCGRYCRFAPRENGEILPDGKRCNLAVSVV